MSADNQTTQNLKINQNEMAKPVALYCTDLTKILAQDNQQTVANLLDFVTAVYAHVQKFVDSAA